MATAWGTPATIMLREAVRRRSWNSLWSTLAFLRAVAHAKNGKREIDLHPKVSAMLKMFIGNRTSGLLFGSRKGTPLGQSNFLRRTLHPILVGLGGQRHERPLRQNSRGCRVPQGMGQKSWPWFRDSDQGFCQKPSYWTEWTEKDGNTRCSFRYNCLILGE